MKQVLCLLVTVGFFLGIVPAAVMAQMKGKTDPAITKLAKEFEVAFNAKDAAKVAAFYAEEATVNPPNEAAVHGRKNIQAWMQKMMDMGLGNMVLTPTESAISGTIAYEAGTYSMTMTPAGGGKPMPDKGKYVVVLKQIGGRWLLAHDIFNSDLVPPPPPKPAK